MHKKIHLFTNTFGKYHRQDLCIDAFKKLATDNLNVDIGIIQFPEDVIEYDVKVYPLLTRSSQEIIPGEKQFPFISDLLDIACENCDDVFVFCNSDIIIHQNLINLINKIEVEAFGVTRTEIDHIESIYDDAKVIREEPSGFDAWVVSKKWWIRNRYMFRDMIIGRPFFDVMYSMLMFLNSKNPYISRNNMIFHVVHEKVAFERDNYYNLNEFTAKEYYDWIEPFWGDLCNNTFWKRPDPGVFLKVNPGEVTTMNTIKQRFLNQ